MKILLAISKYDYGIQERGYSFEYYNFYDTLRGMGFDVECFDFPTLSQHHGKEGMNRMLERQIDEIKPDLLFTFLFRDEFDPETIRRVTSSKKVVTYNWFADDHWRFDDFSRHWAPVFTYVSTTDVHALPKYKSMGYSNAFLTQWAANPRIYKKGDERLKYDLTFVGQSHGGRGDVVRKLRDLGIQVLTYGSGWNARRWHVYARKLRLLRASSFQRIVDSSRITQEEMINVFQTSRINLNLSGSSMGLKNQIKGRNFEIPACGGFQLSGYAEGLEECFLPDKEIVFYNSFDELLERIRHYGHREDERKAIAEAGYQRVVRDHTYEQRFRSLFQQMGLLRG